MCIIAIIVFWGDGICYVVMSTYMCVAYVYVYIAMCLCIGICGICARISKCVLFACIADDNFEFVLLFAAYDVTLINNKAES